MEYFNHADIEGEDIPHELQHILGCSSNQQLINYLSKNLIINWPVLSYDSRRDYEIYGPATAILKGEVVRNKPRHVELKKRIPIQAEILNYHQELPLLMDFCFINGHPYFTTITGKLNYRIIIWCRGRVRKVILKRLQAIVSRNNNRVFQVNEYYTEN